MSESISSEFRPVTLPRNSEWTAWILFLITSATMWIVMRSGFTPSWSWIFWAFLLFSSVSISLGNWLDRNTVIHLMVDSIRFDNKLRRVHLGWNEIQKVAVLPARWGKSVQVIGENSHFNFKTLGEVQFEGEVRGRTGFAEGHTILDTIITESGLNIVEEANNAYYYARG